MNVERSTAVTKKRSPVRSLCLVQSRQSLMTVRLKVVTEVVMNDNKVNPENWLMSVNFEKYTFITLWEDSHITSYTPQ